MSATVERRPESGAPNGVIVLGLDREYWFPSFVVARQIADNPVTKPGQIEAAKIALEWYAFN